LNSASILVLLKKNKTCTMKVLRVSSQRTKTMAKQVGLDNRHRDLDGEIRQKNGNTRIDTLRQTYGDDFAKEHRGDMKLDTLLESSGVRSLSEYLKRK
jgi:hypothetical protein